MMNTKILKFISFFLILFTFTSCTTNYLDDDEYDEYDGTYCAEVTYYNPNTGTRSTYNLDIEVSDNILKTIYWSNGGWLDEDHFTPQELDEGYCEFTSDKGYKYTVHIIGSQCNSSDKSKYTLDRQNDEKKITCSRCGDEKKTYNDYCDDCLDAYCSNCGRFDDYKYFSYRICSDCEEQKERKEKTCKNCGSYDRYMHHSDDYCSNCSD